MAKHITQVIPELGKASKLTPELLARFIIWRRIQKVKVDVTKCNQAEYKTYTEQRLTMDEQITEIEEAYAEAGFTETLAEYAAIGQNKSRLVRVGAERKRIAYTKAEYIENLRSKVAARIEWLGNYPPTQDFIIRS